MTQDSNTNGSAADPYKTGKAGEINFQPTQKKSKYPLDRLEDAGDWIQIGPNDDTHCARAYAARKNFNDKGKGRVEVKKADGFVFLVLVEV